MSGGYGEKLDITDEGLVVFVSEQYVDAPREEDPTGTLLGSLLPDGMHLPIFDLDFDCRLVPSRTEGHFHLYINKPLTQLQYKEILIALSRAGIVQEAWVRRLYTHMRTFLRLPKSLLPDWAPKSRYRDPELETSNEVNTEK